MFSKCIILLGQNVYFQHLMIQTRNYITHGTCKYLLIVVINFALIQTTTFLPTKQSRKPIAMQHAQLGAY